MRVVAALAAVILAGAALALALRSIDAGGDGSGDGQGAAKTGGQSGSRPGAQDDGRENGGGDASSDGSPEPVLPESSCPPDLSNCVVASGQVIYVEAVDPDGDGDAHFVTNSEEGVTFPGVTVFDVRRDLRPDPLPGVGDLVGGAGPVFPGSHGQKQIEVVEFHVAR